jgi:predicted transcriptional regulator
MMKKIMLIVFLLAFAGLVCGKLDAISEYKNYLKDMSSLTESLDSTLEKAKSGKEAADALKNYMVKMDELKKKGEELKQKYPEIGKGLDLIPQLKDEFNKSKEMALKFGSSLMDAQKRFASDKDFKEALDKMKKSR